MGNISFIIPKENLKDFTVTGIVKLVKDNLCEKLNLSIELHPTGQIIIKDKDEETVCEIWNSEDGCYLLDESNEDGSSSNTKKWFKKLKEADLKDTDQCIGISYGWTLDSHKVRTKILTFLIKYFKGYWLDEGIHPEFISYDEKYLDKYVLKD